MKLLLNLLLDIIWIDCQTFLQLVLIQLLQFSKQLLRLLKLLWQIADSVALFSIQRTGLFELEVQLLHFLLESQNLLIPWGKLHLELTLVIGCLSKAKSLEIGATLVCQGLFARWTNLPLLFDRGIQPLVFAQQYLDLGIKILYDFIHQIDLILVSVLLFHQFHQPVALLTMFPWSLHLPYQALQFGLLIQ